MQVLTKHLWIVCLTLSKICLLEFYSYHEYRRKDDKHDKSPFDVSIDELNVFDVFAFPDYVIWLASLFANQLMSQKKGFVFVGYVHHVVASSLSFKCYKCCHNLAKSVLAIW